MAAPLFSFGNKSLTATLYVYINISKLTRKFTSLFIM